MRTVFSRAALLIALLAPSPWIFAEEPLLLAPLLEEAREKNPELRALRERVESLDARTRAIGRLDDPTLKIELEDLSTDRPLDISPDDAMLTRYTFSQMLPFPGKLRLRERIASKEALSARAELSSRTLDVSQMIKEAFFDYAFLDESVRINMGIKELLLDAAKTAEARYATGQVPQQDVLKLNVERSMVTNEIIALEAEKEVAAARLKSLLDRPQKSELASPGELPKERAAFDTNELIDTAVASSPDVKMAEAAAQAGELGADLAGKNYYPDFMVGIAPIQRDGRFDNYDLMFQMNIPIWRGKYDSQAKEAKAAATSARSRLANEKNRKGFEVKSAAIQVGASDRARELYETTLIPQVELSYESALRNYQAGKIDLITLLDTERELRRTRIEYLRTILGYNKRLAALERAVGADIRKGATSLESTGVADMTE
ncbi:MAG TPA: hypothetical protein DDW94_10170 [Deltaproteobacteria bacterium]|nr:MAG: hypothetical protein A2Z79_12765 [Deltaproteobacteria bacterium GWA2_55_82]OGQ63748.1 MAG: hypothetical protein A3I81_12280 [Deltaproteobacteria bacterium RIFCSPLOWO2_02_FULL_55_12]OIJ73471.1 MAG: hypothetical protein A2V21_303835 [Deltaproteobacteria bacterium GWC2_55_46]HBG47337.1 hypothetical protein [Deltaproteobacteria bacterium]HCY10103.1 hypothetical protein [Deltaproteobacteria bacterium]